MLHLRRSALRLFSSQPSSLLTKQRLITTISSSHLKVIRQPVAISFQRRWATGETEAKKEDQAPISELQPIPQEEVENAILEDNAAGAPEHVAPGSKETSQMTAESSQTGGLANESASVQASTATSSHESTEDPNAVGQAINYATESVSNAAGSVSQAASNAYRSAIGSTSGLEHGSDRRRDGGDINTPKSTIYIGNLFFDVTENDLIKELSRFGTITRCRLMRDSRGLSKGFGYIDFETIDSATKAIETLNQQLFEGRRLAVQYAAFETKQLEARRGGRSDRPNKPLNPPSKTLFIGNMSFEMTDRDLNQLFRGIRNVIDVRVAIDRRTGQPRGFAHADFVDVKSAMEAMKVLEQKETYGRKLRLDYSYGSSAAPRNQGGEGAPPPAE